VRGATNRKTKGRTDTRADPQCCRGTGCRTALNRQKVVSHEGAAETREQRGKRGRKKKTGQAIQCKIISRTESRVQSKRMSFRKKGEALVILACFERGATALGKERKVQETNRKKGKREGNF